MSFQVSPEEAVFYVGEIEVSCLPELIQSQTLHSVVQEGSRWTVVDDDSTFVGFTEGRLGLMDRGAYQANRALSRGAEMAGQWRLQLAVVQGGGGVTVSPASLRVEGGGIILDLAVRGGRDFTFADGEQTFQQQYTVLQNTPALESRETSRSSGLNFTGSVYPSGGRVILISKFSLSTALSSTAQRQRSFPIDLTLPVGRWVRVAGLTRADATATLEPLGISVSGSSFALWVCVSPG